MLDRALRLVVVSHCQRLLSTIKEAESGTIPVASNGDAAAAAFIKCSPRRQQLPGIACL